MERKMEQMRKDERGSAMMVAITAVIITVAIAASLTLSLMSRSQSSTNTQDYADLQKMCDAAMTKARRALFKVWTNSGTSAINTYLNTCYTYGTTSVNTIGTLCTQLSSPQSVSTMDTTDTGSLVSILRFHDGAIYIYAVGHDTPTSVGADNLVDIYVTAIKQTQKGQMNIKQVKAVCLYEPPPSGGFTAVAALLAGDSVTLNGNAAVAGTAGIVEANGNLTLNGMAAISAGGYATGTANNDGGASKLYSNQPTFTLPTVNAYTSASLISGNGSYSGITYWVAANGNVYTPSGSPTTSPSVSMTGWNLYSTATAMGISTGADSFSVSGNNTLPNGAYFFETTDSNGSVSFTGNSSGQSVSIFTNGALNIAGNGSVSTTPYVQNVLAVANGNISVTGNGLLGSDSTSGRGLIASNGSVTVSGNGTLYGSTVAHSSSVVDSLNGNAQIVYNGPITTNLLTVNTTATGTLVIKMYKEIK